MGSKSQIYTTNQDNRQAATDNAFVAGVSGDQSVLGLASLSGISNAGDVSDTKGGALLKGINANTMNYSTNQVTQITDGKAFDLVDKAVSKAIDLSKTSTSETLAALVKGQRDSADFAQKLLSQSTDTVQSLAAQQQAAISNMTAQNASTGAAIADGIVGMAAQLSRGLQNGLDSISVGFNSLGESLAVNSATQGDQLVKNQQYMKYALIGGGVLLAYLAMRKG